MSTKLHSLIFFILLSAKTLFAFNDNDWQPVFLTPGGGNTTEGISAYFKVASCNGEDVVYIRFVNDNTYSVKLEWFDVVYDNEMKFIGSKGDKKSVSIPAKTEIKGDCEKESELVIKIKDFVPGKDYFQRYYSSDLNIFAGQ